MKISKTPDGQTSVDLFANTNISKRGVLILAGVAVLSASAVFVHQMNKHGLGWSSLVSAPREVSEVMTYDAQKEAAMSSAQPPKTNNPSGGLPISQKQIDAVAQYTLAMAITDGMGEWMKDSSSGYADGQIAITVTTNFQLQQEPVRIEIADIFLTAWERIYQPTGTERATISLFDSQGRKIGGSKALTREIFFE